MGLFKGIAQTVEAAINFQIVALVLIFTFFVSMAIIVIKRPNSFYKELSKAPLNDELENNHNV